jgi:hypothetical protein
MRPRFIVLLIAGGVVFFCMAFFRTGAPEVQGLERPEINMKTFAGPVTPGARRSATDGNAESRFKEDEKERKPRKKSARSRRSNRSAERTGKVDRDGNRKKAKDDSSVTKAKRKRPTALARRNPNRKPRTKTEYLKKRRRQREARVESDEIGEEVFEEEVYEEELGHPEQEMVGDGEAIDQMPYLNGGGQ